METAISSATSSGSNLRAELMEFIDSCPVDLCKPEECPLYEVRQLNYHRRTEWVNTLTQKDLEYLAAYHYVCMKLKLQVEYGERP